MGYVIAGFSQSNNGDVSGNHGSYDCWVVKLDVTGNLQWQKSLGGLNEDVAQSIQSTSDGGYVMAGYSLSNDGDVNGNHGGSDCWVAKLDATGTIQWQKSMGGSGADVAYKILTTSDGGYMVAGHTPSNDGDVTGNHGGQDYWVVKLAPDALAIPVFEKQAVVIYPNPANDIVIITNSNNIDKIAKVTIYDVTGKTIYTLNDNTLSAINIDVSHFAKGLYLVELSSDSNTKITKKLLLK